MSIGLVRRLHAILERRVPERWLFIQSGQNIRFMRLTPANQFVIWSGGALIACWGIAVTAVVLLNGMGPGSLRDQAQGEQAIHDDLLSAVIAERQHRADEALAARERLAAVLEQVSAMQSELLSIESRRLELELEFEVAQAKLRQAVEEREPTRAQIANLEADGRRSTVGVTELAGMLDLLSGALAETAAERDGFVAEAEEAARLASTLNTELGLMEGRSDGILQQVEDALAVSFERLDEGFQVPGLDPEALLDNVASAHSDEETLVTVQISTRGTQLVDGKMERANLILDKLDRINHYRMALDAIPLAMPVQDAFRYTSPFGPRWGREHQGLDMAGPVGTPIYATADGVVSFAGWQNGYGRIVIVQHEFGLETRYPHLNAIRTEVGQRVARGEQVGDMGSSGRSTGSHLHYEVRVDGEAVDPMSYIRAGRNLL